MRSRRPIFQLNPFPNNHLYIYIYVYIYMYIHVYTYLYYVISSSNPRVELYRYIELYGGIGHEMRTYGS